MLYKVAVLYRESPTQEIQTQPTNTDHALTTLPVAVTTFSGQ